MRVSDVKISLDEEEKDYPAIAAKTIGKSKEEIVSCRLVKKSVDARNKKNVHFICTFDIYFAGEDIENNQEIVIPCCKKGSPRPIVVGSGPAGMFAGLVLAEAGLCPIILERGKQVSERQKDVEIFWKLGKLNPNSNVQFGEGGAGTFSDGKLMSGIKKDEYTQKVLNEFVLAGAPEEILYLAKPHIGTDKLALIIPKIRAKTESLGGEYRFENRVSDFLIENEKIKAIKVEIRENEQEMISADDVILALGHSSRDTFEKLFEKGIKIEQKPFSVGARIEHKQSEINKSQYGSFAGHKNLGAADYKLFCHLPSGTSGYTFCMCPGGTVVAAASEEGHLVTNGMSEYARDKENANSALLVGVDETDFASKHPLAGMYFQRKIEERAFAFAGNSYKAPVQLVGDFLAGKETKKLGDVVPSYTAGTTFCNLNELFPPKIAETMKAAIKDFDNKLRGFAKSDAVLTAPETRSSSPLRIIRDENFESSVKGLYPCGEGAGYAGGIMSAAVDGIKTALKIIKKYER